jgi:hypothetical protein
MTWQVSTLQGPHRLEAWQSKFIRDVPVMGWSLAVVIRPQ